MTSKVHLRNLITLFMLATLAWAGGADIVELRTARLKGQLGLNAEQTENLRKILHKWTAESVKAGMSAFGKAGARRVLIDDLHYQVESLLTQTQKQEFEQIKPQVGWVDLQLYRMNENFSLTEEQAGKIQEILIETAVELDAHRNRTKAGAAANRLNMREIMMKNDEKIEALLNPEQLEAWKQYQEQLRKERRARRGTQ